MEPQSPTPPSAVTPNSGVSPDSEHRLRLLIDLVPVPIAHCDRGHRFKFVNKSYARRWQLPAAELVGRHLSDIMGEQAYRSLLPQIGQVLSGRAVDFTTEISFPEIGTRFLESRYVPELDEHGVVQGWLATIFDVTERKQAEAALRERERELSLIYRNVSDGIFLIAVEGTEHFRFLSVNHAFLAATGLSESDVVGNLAAEVIPEPSYALAHSNYQKAIRERVTVTWEETTLYPSGTKSGVVAVTPLFDSQGLCKNLVGTVHDVTELKRAESTLLEADRRKDEFLAMLAHELRNPLGPIRNGVQILRKLRDDPQTRSRIWDMIDRQSTHMGRLVDDLLDVSRITRGKILLRHEELDLCALVSATAHDYEPQFQQKSVSLLVSTPQSPIYIRGDRTRIAQSVGNLLHNAQKFTYAGGVTKVSVGEDGSFVTITVADTGAGMDELTLSRLFVPFAQADQSLERSTGGLGLGLSLVQGLVQLHNGTVSARSDGIGRGSTMQIRLPRIRAKSPEVSVLDKIATARSQQVLIIEDNTDAAESLRLLLTIAGHTALIAETGPAALTLLESATPDIIICDIGLPGGMSGYELASAVRSQPRFARILMVALTGYGREDDRDAAIAAGFNMHVTKPMDPEKLNLLIQGNGGR